MGFGPGKCPRRGNLELQETGTLSISCGKGRVWFLVQELIFPSATLWRAGAYSVTGFMAGPCHPVILLGVWVDTHVGGDRAYLYGLWSRLNKGQGKEWHLPWGLVLIQQCPPLAPWTTGPAWPHVLSTGQSLTNRQQNLGAKSMASEVRLPGFDPWTGVYFLYLSFPIIKWTWP